MDTNIIGQCERYLRGRYPDLNADVPDIVQNVLTRVGPVEDLTPYLKGSLSNGAKDQLRSKRRKGEESLDDPNRPHALCSHTWSDPYNGIAQSEAERLAAKILRLLKAVAPPAEWQLVSHVVMHEQLANATPVEVVSHLSRYIHRTRDKGEPAWSLLSAKLMESLAVRRTALDRRKARLAKTWEEVMGASRVEGYQLARLRKV